MDFASRQPLEITAMNRRITRWARLAMASSVVAALVGCDNSESAFLDQQANAIAVRAAGGSGSEVSKELTTATEGTLPVNIQANQVLAQARLSDARALADAVVTRQSDADAIVARISSLASLAGSVQTISNTYRQMEPTAATAFVKDLSAKVRGDGNTEKFSDLPNGSIPTLAAVKQEKSRLEGELTKAQGELQTATTQRDQLLTQVGTLSAKADEQRGQPKLDTVTQAADLRQQAAVISRRIGELEGAISVLNADLEVQKSLETNLQAALESFEAQQASLTSGWAATKTQVDHQGQLASSILKAEANDTGEMSVNALAAELNTTLKELDQQREEALGAFSDAASKFTAAETAANTFNATLTNPAGNAAAEAAALKSLAGTLSVDRFNLQKAIAMREQAAVHISHAQFLLRMADVAAQLESLPRELNPAVPEPFNSEKLKADAAEAIKNADELLMQAKDRVEGVAASDESLAGLRPLKVSTSIFVNYDRALLSQLASTAKLDVDVAKEQVYKDSIEAAKAAIVSARESSVIVPNVPSDIYVEPAKPVEEKPAEATAETVPDSPVVAELRQSLKDAIGQAATARDNPQILDQLFARIKTNETSQPIITSIREMADLQVRIQAAVKAKFGDEGAAELEKLNGAAAGGPQMNIEAATKQIDAMKLKEIDETHVEMPLPLPGETPPALKFVREDEAWKLDLTELPPGAEVILGAAAGTMQGMKEKLTQLATDIEGGKYATIEEVKAAVTQLIPGAPQTPPVEGAPATPEATPPAAEPAAPDAGAAPAGTEGAAGGANP
jgi:hypothetical protein